MQNGRRVTVTALGTLAIAAFAAAPLCAEQPLYTATVLPETLTPGGGGATWGTGINNRGQVVGTSTWSNGGYRAFLYTPGSGPGSGMTNLGATKGNVSIGFALNDHGQVVGQEQYISPTGNIDTGQGFLYTPGSGMSDPLGVPNYVTWAAGAINNSGYIAVNFQASGHGDEGGVIAPNLSFGYAYPDDNASLYGYQVSSINESGVTSGVDFTYDYNQGIEVIHAAVFAPYTDPLSGQAIPYVKKGDLSSLSGTALDLTDDGSTVVGGFRPAGAYQTVAYVSDGPGVVTQLANFGDDAFSEALSINNQGQFVGNFAPAGSLVLHGFVYDAGTPGYAPELDTLIDPSQGITNFAVGTRPLTSWSYLYGPTGAPNALNEWGQIVGTANVAGLGQRAVILTPITPYTHAIAGGRGSDIRLVTGMDYDQTASLTNTAPGALGSTAQLLDGDAGGYRDVQIIFDPAGSLGGLASDVVDVSGTGDDVFVLAVTYDPALAAAVFGDEAAAYLAWLDPADHIWKNAVLGNSNASLVGLGGFQGDGAYDPAADFALGNWGVDTLNDTVWAVLDHNSRFAATVNPTPEPTAAAILSVGLVLLARRRRTGGTPVNAAKTRP